MDHKVIKGWVFFYENKVINYKNVDVKKQKIEIDCQIYKRNVWKKIAEYCVKNFWKSKPRI
jgi:hypothetical protein